MSYSKKDDLYVIIDTIYRKSIYYKSDKLDHYHFIEIAQVVFKELIPSSDGLNAAMKFLIDEGLIIRNEYYRIRGGLCKGYKIPSEYLSHPIPVKIDCKKINARILKQIEANRVSKKDSMAFAKSKYMKGFKIDVNAALESIKQKTVDDILMLCENLNIKATRERAEEVLSMNHKWPMINLKSEILFHEQGKTLYSIIHRYIVHITRVNAINDGYLFFKRNTTNNRLDSNLTSLPSYLRKHIIAPEPLVNVDIKNSQPFFLYAVLKDDLTIEASELTKFGELVMNGKLYEYMIEKYDESFGKVKTRKEMKTLVFRVLFSKIERRQPEKIFFRSVFPSIMEFVDSTNQKENNVLAILLQKKEAYCVLDVVMPRLKELGIVPLTIHDSFVCFQNEAEMLKKTFNDEMFKLLGILPTLSVEMLIEEETEEKPWSFENDWDASAA